MYYSMLLQVVSVYIGRSTLEGSITLAAWLSQRLHGLLPTMPSNARQMKSDVSACQGNVCPTFTGFEIVLTATSWRQQPANSGWVVASMMSQWSGQQHEQLCDAPDASSAA